VEKRTSDRGFIGTHGRVRCSPLCHPEVCGREGGNGPQEIHQDADERARGNDEGRRQSRRTPLLSQQRNPRQI
jgi:hypothetical protein